MNFLLLLLSLLLSLIFAKEAPKTLQIGIKHEPKDCQKRTKPNQRISVHYRGKLFSDGTVFDESYKRGQPFDFVLGQGQVIQGWDQGLLNMCIGEKRRLTIPSHLAYGERGAGDKIPAGATLVFDVELLDILDNQQGGHYGEF